MDAPEGTEAELRRVIDLALRGQLTEAQVRRVHRLGPEAVALIILATTRRTPPTLPVDPHADHRGQEVFR